MNEDQSVNPFLTDPIVEQLPADIITSHQSENIEISPPQTLSSRLRELNEGTINKVFKQIQAKKLVINKSKSDFRFEKMKEKPSNVEYINLQRKQIMQKKSQMIHQLNELEKVETHLVKEFKDSRVFVKSRLNMSRLSNEDLQTLKVLKQKKKKQDQILNKRIQQYENSILQYKEERRMLEQKIKEEETVKRKLAAADAVDKILERGAQRKAQIVFQEQQLSKLKQKRKIFEELQIKAKRQQQKAENQLKAKIQMKRGERRMSHSQLRQHEQSYLKKKQDQQNQRKQRLQKSSVKSTPKFKVIFLEGAMEAEKTKIKQSADKWNNMIGNIEKNYVFCQKVREEAKRHIKLQKKSKLTLNESRTRNNNELERSQMYQKGNEYMKVAKQLASNSRNSESMHLPSVTKKQHQSQQCKQNKIVDYLRQKRIKRKDQDSSVKLQKCLRSGKISKAIDIVGFNEGKYHIRDQAYRNALAKIRVLEQLQNRDVL